MKVKRVAKKLTHVDVDLGMEFGEVKDLPFAQAKAALRSTAYERWTEPKEPTPKPKSKAKRPATSTPKENE